MLISLMHRAGHKDSPLTNRGMAQAKALGAALANDSELSIDKIYCSDLMRANWTATEIYKACAGQLAAEDSSKPNKRPKTTSASIPANSSSKSTSLGEPIVHRIFREQFFGDSEGLDWTRIRKSPGRHARFNGGGESSHDVQLRALRVVDRVVKPWLLHCAVVQQSKHIVIVAHGLVSPLNTYTLNKTATRAARLTGPCGTDSL